MRYVFNYPITVAVVTGDGNLTRLRFGCGATVDVSNQTVSANAGGFTMNLEMADGNTLVNVPNHAICPESYAARRIACKV